MKDAGICVIVKEHSSSFDNTYHENAHDLLVSTSKDLCARGEWLLSSYIATGVENVPIFIHADNAENELEQFLSQINKQPGP